MMLPRGRTASGLAIVAAVLAMAVGAQAGISWTSAGGVLATRTIDAPVHFEAGVGVANARYIKDFELSQNKTTFGGTFKPKSGADTTVKDVVSIVNVGAATRSVHMSATQVTNTQVELFQWVVRNGTTVVAVFDYRAASPSATFNVPTGADFEMDIRMDLADGAGKHNAAISFGLIIEVT